VARSLSWGLFLACSWTWCIGMFLPTLLVRDGGLPFFWAFLIPNVLGAASVGWVLRDAQRSRRFVASKRPILLVFSAVTLAFHAYWLTWRCGLHLGEHRPEFLVGIVLGASGVVGTVALRRRVDAAGAAVALAASMLCAVALLAASPDASSAPVTRELAGLAAITALGFGLCPYLDLSFNRACQHAPSPRSAFSLGFLVLFPLIILGATRGRAVWSPAEPVLTLNGALILGAIGAHFGAQSAFTVAAHIAALRRAAPDGSVGAAVQPLPLARWVVAPILAGLLLAPAALLMPATALAMDAPEIVYRLFLGCYGVVFPAWLILSLGGRDPLSRRTLVVLALTVLAASPFAWVGMILLEEIWLLPAAGIVLASRLWAGPPIHRP
jgi:hypothetical protein